jgi:hypothetical protein
MALLKKKEFEQPANVKSKYCVSIFIPTHRAGKEVIESHDRLKLKKKTQELENSLEEKGLNGREREPYISNLKKLLNDSDFWRHQSDGLSVFITKDDFKYYSLPLYFDEYIYISEEFYLKPLLNLFNTDKKFFMLGLSLHDTKLYEATKYEIEQLEVEALTPENLIDTVGGDFKEKVLQMRTGQTGMDGAMYHGHNMAKDFKEEEVEKYLRNVDKGLNEVLREEKAPLVIFGDKNIGDTFKNLSNYKYIHDNILSPNANNVDLFFLHEKAKELLQDYFEKEFQEKINQFPELQRKGKASEALNEIIPASLNGKIDTLFVKQGEILPGKVDENELKIEIDSEINDENQCLLNLAAIQTFKQGGKVYVLHKNDMPGNKKTANAIYRY